MSVLKITSRWWIQKQENHLDLENAVRLSSKHPSMMRNYMRQGAPPEPPKIVEEGWFHMDDLGLIDPEGNIFIIERVSFLFKYYTGDLVIEKISPNEIESVLQEHEAVESAGVVPIPDKYSVHLARAYIILRPGKHVSADEILAHVAARLPKHKHLHGGVRFVTTLPLNSGGKIDRVKLRNMASTDV